MSNPIWHVAEPEQALTAQQATTAGLSAEDASRRLAEHGPNRLTPLKKRGPLIRFLLQFHNVLIYVLLGAAGVTAALGTGSSVRRHRKSALARQQTRVSVMQEWRT